MTDDKKTPGDLDEIDWDEALSEWDQGSFEPEVAKDVVTDKPASLAGASRPLYRPPPVPPPIKPPPQAPALPQIPSWAVDEDEDGTGATRVRHIPEELLRRGEEPSSAQDAAQARAALSTQIEVALPALDADEAAEVAELEELAAKAEQSAPPQPVLLAPQSRRYDPNEVTEVVKEDAELTRIRESFRARSRQQVEDGQPHGTSQEAGAPTMRPMAPPPLPEPPTWSEEKPAREWMSDEMREGFEARAAWLEQEAREMGDDVGRAHALLAVSEISALIGDRERAQSLASEARDAAPSLALAHQQARALLPTASPGADGFVEALETEVKVTPPGAAHIHAMLLMADRLRSEGDDESATRCLDDAVAEAPDDVRAVVARAIRALASDKPTDVGRGISDASAIAPLTEAIETCLRLRGFREDDTSARDRSPIELLLLARRALDRGQIAEASSFVVELSALPELALPAQWLAASLAATQPSRRPDAMRWLRELAERGDEDAARALVMRALELGDTQRLSESVGDGGPLTSAERVTIAALGGLPFSATDPRLDATAATPGMETIAAALTSLAMPADGDRSNQVQARSQRTAGSPNTRALVSLARLVAASAPTHDIDAALQAIGDRRSGGARAIALDTASRAGRSSEVADTLEVWGAGWGSREDGAVGPLAAALISERSENRARAVEAFKAARTAAPTNEAALRAIASLEQVDLVAEMNELADYLGEGVRSAIARIEAAARGEGVLPEPTRAHMLERAHNAAPALPIASFLAERIARRTGDIDEVLRWVRERREASPDPVEAALDAVREALLVADREPLLAAERLQEAHRARENDVALRQLFERLGSESPEARASWREQRAAEATGDGSTLLLLEAAREYERAGDEEAAFRCAQAAAANDAPLGRVARERAELRTRNVARLAEELLATAKGASDLRARREAYERLATVDATARRDPASALLWHRAILEESPGHEPSLRHVEQYLISEGREEELEPIAAGIARSLRGTGAGEATAHAELSVRLRLRAADAKWEAAQEMVELAAAEPEPSLWSLRMLQCHARAKADDALLLTATLKLLDRPLRAPEKATLLVSAGEAAAGLGRLEEAGPFLERATEEQPEDFVAWSLLAEVRRRAGDGRGAAEAYEALARAASVAEHQLQAWYDAGCAWQDVARDPEKAAAALEAAATMNIAYKDVFDRLSHVYASLKMVSRLAKLLERRVSVITDPDERLAMEVTRGRALLEAGDVDGARGVFETVLTEHPEDARALWALADLCVSQADWEAAEQALVRLSRFLPTPDEQRRVYAKLGELYAEHLSNLPRAEVAFKEVLKRAPDDAPTTERLVDVYKRQGDAAHAAEFQQHLVSKSRSPEDKRTRILALATIHEEVGNDKRRAEQTLETARREFPQDVVVLRALADFYTRHGQTPAVNILLDRAGGDARRALAAGRIAAATFEVLAAVFDLRGKSDAARVTKAVAEALGGQRAEIGGAGHRAFDPKLDDLLAPEALTPSVRALLSKTGGALDQGAPLDLRALRATPLPADHPLSRLALAMSQGIGLGDVQIVASPKLGTCVPAGSSPATIVVGESLLGNERVAPFLVVRALKLVHARASALARGSPADLAVLVSAWLKCFNPSWQPQGINPALVNAAAGRIQSALPRTLAPEVSSLALEATGSVGTQPASLGSHLVAWADRVALLALGDCSAALDAIAASSGSAARTTRDAKERSAWLARTPAARDLLAFAVSDAFADARARLGVE